MTVQVLEILFKLIRSNDVIVRNVTKDKWTGGSVVDFVYHVSRSSICLYLDMRFTLCGCYSFHEVTLIYSAEFF